jgi:hypothetical protein
MYGSQHHTTQDPSFSLIYFLSSVMFQLNFTKAKGKGDLLHASTFRKNDKGELSIRKLKVTSPKRNPSSLCYAVCLINFTRY